MSDENDGLVLITLQGKWNLATVILGRVNSNRRRFPLTGCYSGGYELPLHS
jgi:hypothetical protein